MAVLSFPMVVSLVCHVALLLGTTCNGGKCHKRKKIFLVSPQKKHRPALPQVGAVGSLGTILSNISMLLDDVHALFNQIIPDEFGKGN